MRETKREHTFVSARILEQDNLALLEEETRLLREEQIGALNNILEVGFALSIDQGSHIGDIDSLRSTNNRCISINHTRSRINIPSTTWNEEISLETEMRAVTEVGTIKNDLTGYQSFKN